MIELKILTNTYKEEEGEDGQVYEVVDKKNIIIRKFVEVKDITSVQEVLTDRGQPYKSRCMVHIQGEGHMVVKHKYEYIKQLKHGGSTGGSNIGFINT
jgi:hypothetical protein